MISLAADIGGTYSRFVWVDGDGHPLGDEQSFRNARFDSLEQLIRHGRALVDSSDAIDRMVLAVPGPVHSDPIDLTNIDWTLRREALRREFRLSGLTVVNDFQAAALGAVAQAPDQRIVLNPGQPEDGPVVVTGAGTGLGMAWLPSTVAGAVPRATEGGHVDFAPNNERQAALRDWLAGRYGHVSYERVLSGPGLVNLYRFLAPSENVVDEPAQITAMADGGDRSAGAAITMFVEIFAAFAGNIALAFNPSGGIYLCGGVTARLARWFDHQTFVPFLEKGRMREVAQRIPVYLVQTDGVGLAGALHILQNQTERSHDYAQ